MSTRLAIYDAVQTGPDTWLVVGPEGNGYTVNTAQRSCTCAQWTPAAKRAHPIGTLGSCKHIIMLDRAIRAQQHVPEVVRVEREPTREPPERATRPTVIPEPQWAGIMRDAPPQRTAAEWAAEIEKDF